MLKVFNLSHNGLGDEGALGFIDALKVNTTLTELDIRYTHPSSAHTASTHIFYYSNNRFSSATASNFASKVIPSCEALKILRVSHCSKFSSTMVHSTTLSIADW